MKNLPIIKQVIDNAMSEADKRELEEQFRQWHISLDADLEAVKDFLEKCDG